MYVLPTTCIRLEDSDNLTPGNVHLLSQLAPRTQYLAAAVVTVPCYVFDLELEAFLQSTSDKACGQVVVLRGLASSPFALTGDDTPADLDKVRPNPMTLIVLFRSHSLPGSDDVADMGRGLQQRIPFSTLHPYARLVRVNEIESDAVLVHEVIEFPKQRPEPLQITAESLWVVIDALAMQKGIQLGPWGMEWALWCLWRDMIAQNIQCPVMIWTLEDEIPRCEQTRLLRKQASFGVDPVIRQSCVSSMDPLVRTLIEVLVDRGIESDESKARRELCLEAQCYGLNEGDLITAEVVRSELREFKESSKL